MEPVLPKSSPNVRLRESGEPQVATKSPIPARPAALKGSAPCAAHSRATSFRPRVISIAWVFSPKPMPIEIPTAKAITFLIAPANSQPNKSTDV